VVDGSDPAFRRQMTAVEDVLAGIIETPRPTVLVFNKADLLDDAMQAALRLEFPDAFLVSAQSGEGLDALRRAIWDAAATAPSTNGRAPHTNGGPS
jgi:GTP-binding protein HflX